MYGALGKSLLAIRKLTDHAVKYRNPGMFATVDQKRAAMKTTRQVRALLRRELGLS